MIKQVVLASVLTLTLALGYVGMPGVEGKTTEQSGADGQTRAVVEAASAFLKSLNPDQRQRVQFAFTPQKGGTIAPFHRTADGGVAPGAPAEGQHGGPGGQARALGSGAPVAGPAWDLPVASSASSMERLSGRITRSATRFGLAFVLIH
jgi:hypothetical protein